MFIFSVHLSIVRWMALNINNQEPQRRNQRSESQLEQIQNASSLQLGTQHHIVVTEFIN